jgi:hypothetical protein
LYRWFETIKRWLKPISEMTEKELAAEIARLEKKLGLVEGNVAINQMVVLGHDPIEDDPQTASIIMAAEKEAEEELAHRRGHRKYNDLLWRKKKQILRKKYGIDWKSREEIKQALEMGRR